MYAHPIEHVISNVVPVFLGPLLMGAHAFTLLLWFVAVLFTTCTHHSGYHFPFMTSSEFHDYHHLKVSPPQQLELLGWAPRPCGAYDLLNPFACCRCRCVLSWLADTLLPSVGAVRGVLWRRRLLGLAARNRHRLPQVSQACVDSPVAAPSWAPTECSASPVGPALSSPASPAPPRCSHTGRRKADIIACCFRSRP